MGLGYTSGLIDPPGKLHGMDVVNHAAEIVRQQKRIRPNPEYVARTPIDHAILQKSGNEILWP